MFNLQSPPQSSLFKIILPPEGGSVDPESVPLQGGWLGIARGFGSASIPLRLHRFKDENEENSASFVGGRNFGTAPAKLD
jgi:hypothetical protein